MALKLKNTVRNKTPADLLVSLFICCHCHHHYCSDLIPVHEER